MQDTEMQEIQEKTFRDFPITRRADGSYIITQGGYPCHVPNSGEWAALWAEVDAYAQEHAEQVTDAPEPPAPTLTQVKASAIAKIDAETSAAILAGFDYEVDGETLHFSYDAFDQQNFADTANVAMLAASGVGAKGMPTQVTWNAYRGYSAETGGELVRLTLDAQSFLALYTQGALAHKQALMEAGGKKKAAAAEAKTVEEVNAAMQGAGA